VTGGPEHRPVKDASVSLVQTDDESYYKLPKEQQFPVDPIGRTSIFLHAARHETTNEKGVAEFWVAPGSYQLSTYSRGFTTPPQTVFKLSEFNYYTVVLRENAQIREVRHDAPADGFQIEVNFEDATPEPRLLKGRVVLRDKPEVGVADVLLKGTSVGDEMRWIQGASDRQGNFTVTRGKGEVYLYARTLDGKMRGIRKIGPAESDVVVPIGATASAHGRIFDHEDKAMAGASIEYGVQIAYPNRTFSTSFGTTVTSMPDGSFTIDGLVPGVEYNINVATSFTDDGRPNGWNRAGMAKPAGVERIELGELKLPPPYRPKTSADYAAEAFAKPEPFDQRLAAALRRAKLSTQNVMLILGSAKAKPVMRFFIYRYDFRNTEFWNAMMEHWLIAVDTERASEALGAWAERNNVRLPGPGFVMVILDPDGKVMGQSTSDLLSTDGELDRRLVLEFAKKYSPAKPDGKKLFDEALARAKAEAKKVLFDESGPYCGPCYQFSEYLEANKELIERDYVCVTLDYRFAGASEIFKQLKAATSTPWIAVLDADGKILATSDGPDGNVGFERPQWEMMLRATASKLTAAQIATLLEKVKE